RLADIDALLRPPAPAAPAAPARPVQRSTAVAAVSRQAPPPQVQRAPSRLWIQLASGPDREALRSQFERIAAHEPDLFKGISPYASLDGSRYRLLIGPFRSKGDVQTFAEDLDSAHIDGFGWTNPEGQLVFRLAP